MVLSGVLVAVDCSGSPPEPALPQSAPPPTPVERYMPLTEGFVYEYDLEGDTGEKGRMMMHVSRPRPGLVELDVAGKVQRLELAPDGIRHATGGYLLKAPLKLGAQWKGQFGTVKVVDIARSIQTPAGSFSSCLVTVEEQPSAATKRATSVFCPGVGLVSLAIEASVDGEYGSVTSILRSHGPKATGFE